MGQLSVGHVYEQEVSVWKGLSKYVFCSNQIKNRNFVMDFGVRFWKQTWMEN